MSAIDDKVQSLRAAGFDVGDATSDEQDGANGGRFRNFVNASIYWSADRGAFEVHGAIRSKYQALGAERFLGYPVTDETGCADGQGRYNDFQQGMIYWSQATGAVEVHGNIGTLYASLGRERSTLGYPVADEADTPDAQGRVSAFQGGKIWWHAGVDAFVAVKKVRVLFKILTAPTSFSLDTMLLTMRRVYAQACIAVENAGSENLSLPALNDPNVGSCTMGSTTSDQNALFANRNGAGSSDVCAYLVRSTVPPLNGCAAFPSGEPGAVIVSTSSQWTLGHEIGHVLGLAHVNDNTRLMTGNGTFNISVPLATLVASEIATMQASPFAVAP